MTPRPAPLPVRPLAALAALALACVHVPTSREKDSAEIHYDLGVSAVREGKTPDALREFQQAVKLWPDFPEPHNALGLLYHWSFRRLDDAEKEFREAVELRPGFSEAWNNLGVLLAEKGDRKGARAAFERALADTLYPTPWIAQTNLGWLRFEAGEHAEGQALVEAAVVARPGYCMAHRQLARIHEAKGRAEAAAASWERFAETCPDEPEALLRRGTLRLRDGEVREAREALERCIAVARERPPAADCRALLARVPQLPEAPAPAPEPGRADEAGRSVKGARDLDSAAP